MSTDLTVNMMILWQGGITPADILIDMLAQMSGMPLTMQIAMQAIFLG